LIASTSPPCRRVVKVHRKPNTELVFLSSPTDSPLFFDQRPNSVQICTVTTSRGRAQTLIPSPIGHRLLIALSRDTIDLAGHLRFD
jgi:hypothetical protein